MPFSLSALSDYLPTAETVLKASDKCEGILAPTFVHCCLGMISVGTIGLSFKISGQANLFFAALNNQFAAQCVFSEEFLQKFPKADKTSFFRILCIQLPLVPILRLMGTPERAHALGQLFLNTGSRIFSIVNLLGIIARVAAIAFGASMLVKNAALTRLNKDYDWKIWEKRWEQQRGALKIHSVATICLILLHVRIPIIYKDR